MKMLRFFAAMVIAMTILAWCAAAETVMCAVSVGKGDAIIIRVGESAYLIDTGKGYACGRLDRAMREMGITHLDGVFITHIDSDHTEGIDYLAQSGIGVNAVYASPCFFDVKPKKHPALRLGKDVTLIEAGDTISIPGGGVFTVLAPIRASEDDEDDNSLVIMLETADGRILLTGDMEAAEEATLTESGLDISCDVLKVPNHGDGDACGQALVDRASPEIAVISTDPFEKPDTPDERVMERLIDKGAEVFITAGCDAIMVTLDGGNVAAERVDWADEVIEGIEFSVDRDGEVFTIGNTGAESVDVTGWYIYSEKGNELYLFPNAVIGSGDVLRLGTKSSATGSYDLLWDEKNVISDKKGDVITLYGRDGNALGVSR